ncbi:MAG: hypothetical protein QXW00_01900 [Candidatus Woesearchaeota archaeon]
MNMEINHVKQKIFLSPESILKYLLGTDDYIDTMISCRGSEFEISTYDYNLYEAVGSIKPYDTFKLARLVKLLEVVKILPLEGTSRPILKEERVEELRRIALSGSTPNSIKND